MTSLPTLVIWWDTPPSLLLLLSRFTVGQLFLLFTFPHIYQLSAQKVEI